MNHLWFEARDSQDDLEKTGDVPTSVLLDMLHYRYKYICGYKFLFSLSKGF